MAPDLLAAELRGHIAGKRQVLDAMAAFAARGIPVQPLWYEEYRDAPEPFLTALLARLGLNSPLTKCRRLTGNTTYCVGRELCGPTSCCTEHDSRFYQRAAIYGTML